LRQVQELQGELGRTVSREEFERVRRENEGMQ
jgi:hypothetical protein